MNSSQLCSIRERIIYSQKIDARTYVELMQEKNIEKVSIPEAYLGPCQLSMMNFLQLLLRTFSILLFIQEHLHHV